ncbi:malectin domain-containing carbohydrate-binding protein [Terriglobus saanensis]|uniref:Carbohydrate binding family 6 n=1 Tax=Terriglobus saanensis (strain ATCC BAA-1853 / DSM 23119 / SP1PR4) TaxID=401053 RepID=E8V7F5_TERSS|nr:malectin domain-containing carbohydrate-binding protein [Terriglobus saanensis]ADV83929.1 Carbohydrate binding family 6 [Terriglobus saanensis SP1PR4]
MKNALLALLLMLSLGAGTMLAQDSGACPTPQPTSKGNGLVAGVPVDGGGLRYYFPDALLGGFDCFEQLKSWFPSTIASTGSINPKHIVVDMAYADEGTATFFNVVVPVAGAYTLDFRYAFEEGLYPGVKDRPEGITVNGVLITNDMHFPETGSFEVYQDQTIVVPLVAGKNTVQMTNIAAQSVSRVDSMTVTPYNGAVPCEGLPTAISGLSAQAASTTQINLNWNASTAPMNCGSVTYNVYRSTTPAFTPSGSSLIASQLITPQYSDTNPVCDTTYYYAVAAADPNGTSSTSNQVTVATNECPAVGNVQINAGGPEVDPFVADIDFAGGGKQNHTNTIDLTAVPNPAPMAVYQSAHTGNFTYTIPGFNHGSTHTIRLHFAETYFKVAGARTFNVTINGNTALTNFDIFAASGGINKAIVEEFTLPASDSGSYVISFASVVNSSLLSGIEIH